MADLSDLVDLTFRVQKRKRPDRHPYQLSIEFGLIGLAVSQLLVGVPPDSPMAGEIRYSTTAMLNILFLVGATLSLIGATLHRDRDPRLSLRLGISGQFGVFVGVACYTAIIVMVTNPPYWLSWLSGALGFGVTYASGHRMIQQWQALQDLKKMVDIVEPEPDDDR